MKNKYGGAGAVIIILILLILLAIAGFFIYSQITGGVIRQVTDPVKELLLNVIMVVVKVF